MNHTPLDVGWVITVAPNLLMQKLMRLTVSITSLNSYNYHIAKKKHEPKTSDFVFQAISKILVIPMIKLLD